MDLRSLANSVSSSVNDNMIVTVQASAGWTIDPATLKQVPDYSAPVSGPAQLQALDGADLRQLDNINLQDVMRAIYLRGPLAGIIRANSKGGDLVTIEPPAPAQFCGTWLVTKVLETWPLWTKCAITLQEPA